MELSRRNAVAAGAWAVPVAVVAASAPNAVASEPLAFVGSARVRSDGVLEVTAILTDFTGKLNSPLTFRLGFSPAGETADVVSYAVPLARADEYELAYEKRDVDPADYDTVTVSVPAEPSVPVRVLPVDKSATR